MGLAFKSTLGHFQLASCIDCPRAAWPILTSHQLVVHLFFSGTIDTGPQLDCLLVFTCSELSTIVMIIDHDVVSINVKSKHGKWPVWVGRVLHYLPPCLIRTSVHNCMNREVYLSGQYIFIMFIHVILTCELYN